jgi:CRP/FNR family transcriptional regulator
MTVSSGRGCALSCALVLLYVSSPPGLSLELDQAVRAEVLVELTVSQILRGSAFFGKLDPGPMSTMAGMGRLVRLVKGQRVFTQGEPCPGIYIVGSGLVRVYKIAPSGKEHLLHLAEPGSTFAEVAVIGRFDCPASAEAVEDALCALLPRDAFVRALEADHLLCRQLLGSMAQWVRQLVGLMEDLVLRDASGRLARHLLLSQGAATGTEFSFPMLKKDMANHLNLTSETVSRTLRRMAESGMIELLDGNRIRILDASSLQDLVEGLGPKL